MRRANASSGRSAPPRKPIAQQHGLCKQVIDDVDGLQRVAVTMIQPVCRLAGHEIRRPRIASKNYPNEGVALSDGHVALDRVLQVQPTVLHHLI